MRQVTLKILPKDKYTLGINFESGPQFSGIGYPTDDWGIPYEQRVYVVYRVLTTIVGIIKKES